MNVQLGQESREASAEGLGHDRGAQAERLLSELHGSSRRRGSRRDSVDVMYHRDLVRYVAGRPEDLAALGAKPPSE